MSTQRDGGLIRFTCDERGCRANYESDEEFKEAWAEAKASGWVAGQDRATWRHYCPKCKLQLGDD